jgi:hypothetical protein
MSVGSLILSPLSAGLFKRGIKYKNNVKVLMLLTLIKHLCLAIMQSGSPNSYLGSESKDHSMVKAKSLATSLKCNTTSMEEMVKCLRSKTSAEILKMSKNARANGVTFEPVYDEALLPIKPYEALEKGQFNQNIDLMFGTVKEEGALFVESLFPALSPDEKNPTITASKAKQYITLMFLMFKEKYGDDVADFYVTSQGLKDNEKDKLRQAVGRAFGDYHLTCWQFFNSFNLNYFLIILFNLFFCHLTGPTVLYGSAFAQHSKANRAYAYRLTHPPSIPVFPFCHGWLGVCHGDDGRYNLFLFLCLLNFDFFLSHVFVWFPNKTSRH